MLGSPLIERPSEVAANVTAEELKSRLADEDDETDVVVVEASVAVSPGR